MHALIVKKLSYCRNTIVIILFESDIARRFHKPLSLKRHKADVTRFKTIQGRRFCYQ